MTENELLKRIRRLNHSLGPIPGFPTIAALCETDGFDRMKEDIGVSTMVLYTIS